MSGVTIRAFCMGLQPGQSATVQVGETLVEFRYDRAQVDIETDVEPLEQSNPEHPTE